MQLILVVPCYAQSQPILWATRLQILEVKLMEIIKVEGNFLILFSRGLDLLSKQRQIQLRIKMSCGKEEYRNCVFLVGLMRLIRLGLAVAQRNRNTCL